jgi:hypothetical protein
MYFVRNGGDRLAKLAGHVVKAFGKLADLVL